MYTQYPRLGHTQHRFYRVVDPINTGDLRVINMLVKMYSDQTGFGALTKEEQPVGQCRLGSGGFERIS